jgi:hypothetical protein
LAGSGHYSPRGPRRQPPRTWFRVCSNIPAGFGLATKKVAQITAPARPAIRTPGLWQSRPRRRANGTGDGTVGGRRVSSPIAGTSRRSCALGRVCSFSRALRAEEELRGLGNPPVGVPTSFLFANRQCLRTRQPSPCLLIFAWLTLIGARGAPTERSARREQRRGGRNTLFTTLPPQRARCPVRLRRAGVAALEPECGCTPCPRPRLCAATRSGAPAVCIPLGMSEESP